MESNNKIIQNIGWAIGPILSILAVLAISYYLGGGGQKRAEPRLQSESLNQSFTKQYIDSFKSAHISKVTFLENRHSDYPDIEITFNNGTDSLHIDGFDALEPIKFSTISILLYEEYKNSMGVKKGFNTTEITRLIKSLNDVVITNIEDKVTVSFSVTTQRAISLPEAKALLEIYINLIVVERATNNNSWYK